MTQWNPVDELIRCGFGSQAKLAAAVGRKQGSASGWKRAGHIPGDIQVPIMEAAKAAGFIVTPNHFFPPEHRVSGADLSPLRRRLKEAEALENLAKDAFAETADAQRALEIFDSWAEHRAHCDLLRAVLGDLDPGVPSHTPRPASWWREHGCDEITKD